MGCQPFRIGIWNSRLASGMTSLKRSDFNSTSHRPLPALITFGRPRATSARVGTHSRVAAERGMRTSTRIRPPLFPRLCHFCRRRSRAVFGACADLRSVRKLLLQGHNGPLFTSDPWQEIALIDVVLTDWQHLAEFIQRTDLPFSGRKDMNLIKGIQNSFGFEY